MSSPSGRTLGAMSSHILLGVLSVAAAPALASAQSSLEIEVRGGVASAVEELNHYTDPGAIVGVGIGWRLSDRLALWADGDLEVMSEDLAGTVVLPSTYLWHTHGGLELGLVQSDTSPWYVQAKGGAGATIMDTERFFEGGDDFLHTYFSVSGGLRIGYRYSERVDVGVLGQAFVTFAEETETAELAGLSPLLTAFDQAVSFPAQAFLRLRMP